ncbi:MAG: hypothetical protein A2015_16960 [Spirochaetes bacterium GWF1_31_7]|nr:MAG: hypothetical protein A2Y30_14325 [Spirochaetes bacterium GWE1_32_154]OHD50133.1 MAG: hypothetical protein A2Y29_12370 [Spirochaetes bacterium GWE2_31_10]OHD52447.1 MAG: hypothetical protein A2015_16960 [Spirochaetes bacterium GWF1_31_7]OHD80087.1 MAG: hypothetical protein A2355_12030 [Spirochaetes bacterium RIFOXYB1_FULL_32_8]HBD96092.1 hypothetical protein [Spirochaetia bacterium]
MKRILSVLSLIAAVMMIASCEGGAETTATTKATALPLHGYTIAGNDITFYMNEVDYPSFDEVESMTLAGEFNGWDPAAAEWQMTDDDGDKVWEFKTTLDKTPVGSKFKYVSNQVDWNQPAADKLDKKYLADDGFGGFNLVIVAE